MTTQPASNPRGRLGRSALALGAGLIINVAAALALDQLFHVLQVYPPWGEPMTEPADYALALGYRLAIAVAAAHVTARLAPFAPLGHALVLGVIGLVLTTFGAVAAIAADLGSLWYPIALAAATLPCAWLGGRLAVRR